MKDIYDILREFGKRRGEKLALATLVHAEGSSYRRPGARMLISADGHTVGSLSGGCLEEEVALQARDVLETGQPALMTFDTRRRFGCAGRIDIFVEHVSPEFLAHLAKQIAARRGCRATTIFEGNSTEMGSRTEVGAIYPNRSGDWGQSPLPASEKEIMPDSAGRFVQEIHPPIQLLIFGDGPDSLPLCSLAQLLGWVPILLSDIESIAIEPDEWTAAIVKSHNYRRDFAVLKKLLPINLRYLGLVGPRKRRDQLLNDLLDAGIVINAGFFAPAGLDLKAETPEEIALAILSEIQRVFAGGTGEPLRERKFPIHNSPRRNEENDETVRPASFALELQRARESAAPRRDPS